MRRTCSIDNFQFCLPATQMDREYRCPLFFIILPLGGLGQTAAASAPAAPIVCDLAHLYCYKLKVSVIS